MRGSRWLLGSAVEFDFKAQHSGQVKELFVEKEFSRTILLKSVNLINGKLKHGRSSM